MRSKVLKSIGEKKTNYSSQDLVKLKKLANTRGGKVFKKPRAAKDYLNTL